MTEKKVVGRNIAVALGIICIILAVGVVGAFAYYIPVTTDLEKKVDNLTNIVNASTSNSEKQTLQNYTDVVAIHVFDVGRMVNGTEQGICVMSFGEYFAFSPKQNFLGVSHFSYVLEAYKEGSGLRFYQLDYFINSHYIRSDHLEIIDYYPSFRTLGADSAVQYVVPGINYVTFQFTDYLFILKMDVYIEYVYQA